MIRPLVGVSSPPSKCSIVDFPQPDGPMTATNSPVSMLIDTPRNAGTSTLPTRYVFSKLSAVRILGISTDALFIRQGINRIKICCAHRGIKCAHRSAHDANDGCGQGPKPSVFKNQSR